MFEARLWMGLRRDRGSWFRPSSGFPTLRLQRDMPITREDRRSKPVLTHGRRQRLTTTLLTDYRYRRKPHRSRRRAVMRGATIRVVIRNLTDLSTGGFCSDGTLYNLCRD